MSLQGLTLFLSLFPHPHINSYNGCLASGDKGRRRSRLALSRRPHANGVKPDVMHHISTPLVSKASSLSCPPCPRPRSTTFSDLNAHTLWSRGAHCVITHCLLGRQRNCDHGKSFAVCTAFDSFLDCQTPFIVWKLAAAF